MDSIENVAARLKETREKNDDTQERVADVLGISRSFYARIENAGKRLSLENAAKFAELYGVSVDWLLHGDSGRQHGNVYGNVHGYVSENVHGITSVMEEAAEPYGGIGALLELLKQKDRVIRALESENAALRDLIALLKKHQNLK